MRRRWLAGMLTAGLGWSMVTAVPAAAAPVPEVVGTSRIADLVSRAAPAVVNIDTVTRRPVRVVPFRGPGQTRYYEQHGLGSGFVVDANGVVVTNNHVIKGAQEVVVTLHDGRQFTARVIGRDAAYDLAVLKIPATRLPTLAFADLDKVRVGEWVVAMGSPLGLDKTVTQGIVSAMNRNVAVLETVPLIQTDAAINPGNSGGPLLGMDGKVVGVTTAMAAGAQGIGFAIPADLAKEAIGDLIKQGRIIRPWLGVGVYEITPQRSQQAKVPLGLFVMEVYRGTGAAAAGLEHGDVITAIAGKDVKDLTQMRQALAGRAPGDRISVTVVRDGRKRQVTVALGELPLEAPSP